jgi:hypothetical protein
MILLTRSEKKVQGATFYTNYLPLSIEDKEDPGVSLKRLREGSFGH